MRTVRADLHNHIGDKKDIEGIGVDNIIKQASLSLGQGGILGIVNFVGQHDSPDRYHYDNFRNLCNGSLGERELGNGVYFPERDILVVRGEEVVVFERGYESHMLALGTPDGTRMKPEESVEYFLDEASEKNAIVGLDHPFAPMGLLRVLDEGVRKDQILASLDFFRSS